MAGMYSGEKVKIIVTLAIDSPSFRHNGMIPALHTCDGLNVSPALAWSGVPSAAKSLVLIVDDPDAPDPAAPKMTWVHWLLYNIPPDTHGLPESVAAGGLPPGTLQGLNDWRSTGYRGPCPPIGKHRYFFKLYAMNVMLPDLKNPAKAILENTMRNHVIGQAELMASYQRSR